MAELSEEPQPEVAMIGQEQDGPNSRVRDLGDGTVRVVDDSGKVLLEHAVEGGAIWRAAIEQLSLTDDEERRTCLRALGEGCERTVDYDD